LIPEKRGFFYDLAAGEGNANLRYQIDNQRGDRSHLSSARNIRTFRTP
jgi:hypothetical protein